MNKQELVSAIAVESGLSKVDAKIALEAVVKCLSDVLVAGDKISLIGFGTFSVTERAAHEGRNPSTNLPMHVSARKAVKFKAGTELTTSIN